MGKARLAVVGLNFGRNHAVNIKTGNMDAELVGIADLNPAFKELGESLKTDFYTDYKALLEDKKPDGVIIAVPPQFHKPIAEDCMRAGAHVMVEKPVTLTSEEADELIAEAEKYGKKILVGQHHRFDPSVLRARARIASGELGRLIGFHIFGTLPKPEWYFNADYRRMRNAGGGTVANNGIHDVDRIRYLCGDVEAVYAMKGNMYRGFEVEDTAAVSIKCKSGAVGTYYISDCSHPLTEYTDFYFTEKATVRFKCSSFYAQAGFMTYEEGALDTKEFAYHLRERDIHTVQIPVQNNHAKEIGHFCDVILKGAEPVTTGIDGKKSMEVMNAVIESLDTGKPVYLK